MIGLYAVLAALALGQPPARPGAAAVGLDAIIRGIEKDQENWTSQKSWMVRYTNSRERIDPVPGQYMSYGDNQIINARKGPWAFLSEEQADSDGVGGRRTWCSWKDNRYTDRNHLDVTIYDAPQRDSKMFFNVWLYPMGLSRDSLSDTFAMPEEIYREPEGLWMELPRCLKNYGEHYRVRKDMEDVDGFPCHAVEWPKKDIIWIDPAHGYHVRRRVGFQASGDLLFQLKASRFKERTPGIWLPDRLTTLTYNLDRDPKEYHGRVAYVMVNALHEARFGDVPDDLFVVPQPKGVRVHDLRKSKDR
jgi:hypothetical protein